MRRRTFLGGGVAAGLAAARKPNFIVIMTDDQGSHDLGCFGATDLKTPHIDALAASGAKFTNWYANAPVCAPSRAALMTGRYPARAGVTQNGQELAPSQATTASVLKSAGYSTGLIGKWHLGDKPDTVPNAHGFDYFYGFHPGCVDFYSHRYYWGEGGAQKTVNFHSLYRNREEIFEDGEYLTDRITDEAQGFIRRNSSNPFFLTVTYNAPHYPMHAPRKYIDRFPGLERERQTYAAMIAGVDDGVGAIRRTLSQSGLLDNTLIFFLADNGATTENRAGLNQQPATAGNNGAYRGFKFSLFDGGMHVPGIMSWPGVIPARQTINEVAMTMDILPTVCRAAGAAVNRRIDGSDILPVASAAAKSPHKTIFWENGQQLAARRDHWKLVLNGIVWGRTAEERKPLMGEDAVFLSDLSHDPGETKNLRRVHPQIVDELMTEIQGLARGGAHRVKWLAGLAFAALAFGEKADVAVYGATSGGVIAAVAAAREGLKVVLYEPRFHLGGMSSGGLGHTDHGRKETIGGYSLEFYQRVGKKYKQPVTWYFEPHIAEQVFREMVKEAGVKVYFGHRLRDDGGVRKRRGKVKEIYFENGASVEASVFIDASYEGDVMAQARVESTVGRESSDDYNESLAGVRPKDRNHQFDFPVEAVWGVPPGPRAEIGSGDKKVQAYNFRLCLTSEPANQIPFPVPPSYDAGKNELLLRYIAAFEKKNGHPPVMKDIFIVSPLPNNKTDINNRGPVSTDYIGANYEYPAGDWKKRNEIWQDHIDYTAGMFYFLANDERVPEPLRKEIGKWGLAADEFGDSNNWPHQLYVREARRMVGPFVMTQTDIQKTLTKPDSIGMGSYNSDSHNVQRFVEKDGSVQNEGNMEVPVEPYEIPYRVLLPKKKQAANLLVPVCVSSSHVAYSTLRMEPVYMIMGHAAGVAAKLAIDAGVAVQDVEVKELQEKLKKQGAVLGLK